MHPRFSLPRQLALFVPLAFAATATYADPFSLTSSCSVTSIVTGQAKCGLTIQLLDEGFESPANVRKAQLKVNNVLVLQTNNDTSNPVSGFADYTITSVAANCGGVYYVTGFVALVGATSYEQVGNVPAITCPTAP